MKWKWITNRWLGMMACVAISYFVLLVIRQLEYRSQWVRAGRDGFVTAVFCSGIWVGVILAACHRQWLYWLGLIATLLLTIILYTRILNSASASQLRGNIDIFSVLTTAIWFFWAILIGYWGAKRMKV
jgi:hypothetical protein